MRLRTLYRDLNDSDKVLGVVRVYFCRDPKGIILLVILPAPISI